MMRRFFLLVAWGSALAPGTAFAECLASEALCSQTAYAPMTPTFHALCDNPVMAQAGIDYDVPAGRIVLGYDEAMSIALSLRDAFTVTGPPPGTPVSMRVRLRFAGTGGGYGRLFPGSGGTMWLRLLEPVAGETQVQKTYGAPFGWNGTMSFADSLDLAFSRPAGSPFGLEIHGDASNGYFFQNVVRFTFLDLPPGSQVTSCKGFLQDQPTPIAARSWGRVKAAYR